MANNDILFAPVDCLLHLFIQGKRTSKLLRKKTKKMSEIE